MPLGTQGGLASLVPKARTETRDTELPDWSMGPVVRSGPLVARALCMLWWGGQMVTSRDSRLPPPSPRVRSRVLLRRAE